ncbi:hypothetical protein, partial [Endozoicomonas sp. SESOKO3]|uniref:hypothetical protein n=1 Tax=Endozoicomonas sp. SESOKO3 TaxID=2828744 RepID=UPI0021476F77
MRFALPLPELLPNNSPPASLELPALPIRSMKQTKRADLMAISPEVLEHSSNALIVMGAAGGGNGDKTPDGNHWKPNPEPQPELTPVLSLIQKCLQQKRQLLRMLRFKRRCAFITRQATLARILSDRIMVIEGDLLDLERSDPAMMHPGLVQAWLAENSQELSVYREIAAGKNSGRQAGRSKNNQPCRSTKASTTAPTKQAGQSGQTHGAATHNQATGSADGSDRGGGDPLKPPAEQDTGNPVVICPKCNKALNQQELKLIANETTASVFLCNKCLQGTQGKKRARRTREETEPDASEPAQKKKKGSVRKRINSKAVASEKPPAKKRKPIDTQVPDDPLESVKENIQYELSEEELEKAQTLMAVFKKKNITVKHSFYKLLGYVERKLFNDFFDNAIVFFWHLPETFKNTGMLTGMLKNKKKHIRDFAERNQDELAYLASLDLLTSFSSMNNGKGVPKHEEVKAMLDWPEWKDKDGKFSMELFRSISSMYNRNGLPKHEEVKEMLSWPEWKNKDGEFSVKLFRSFSSMNHGKGMLKHEELKEVVGWPEWKDRDGEFNMELLRAFSSMNRGKGMLKHEKVKEVLSWPEWKGKDGEFSAELFRSFSSMNNGQGILSHEKVKEVLGWPEWKNKDGEFSIELLRSFSSMYHSRGMLNHKEVKEVLGWPEWKDKNGVFSFDLFRAFSSINHSKGMPKHEDVKEVLGWPEWKDSDGEFSIELFRAFSSMNNGLGILNHEEVQDVLGWPEWKNKDGEFSMGLLRAFSSMNHSKGILKREDVKEVLGWPEWRDKDGQFDIERFRPFSSMNNGLGVPKHKKVKEVLGWSEWKDSDGEFSVERFRAFSSMYTTIGVLKHKEVKDVLDWTSCGGAPNHQLLQVMTRLWKSEGLPAADVLQRRETELKEWLSTEFTEENSNSDNEEDNNYNLQIKTVALYLSTSKPEWSLKWTALKQFHQFRENSKTVLMLESLIKLLSFYGGKGVELYLQSNAKDRFFLRRHSARAVPLHVLNKAVVLFSANEYRGRFVYFVKRLKSLPDKSLWEQQSARLQQLSEVLKLDYMKRLYWEILQPLTNDDQLRFLDASHARAVFDLFPSFSALHKLSKEHSSQWFKQLLEACLGLKNHEITKEGIQILLEALLKTHSLLPWYNDIPDHFLSGMRTTDDNNVMIPVSGLIPSGEQLALSYIAVLMQNINEMFFTVRGQWLEVEVPGKSVRIYRFPMPQLKIQNEKMEISN